MLISATFGLKKTRINGLEHRVRKNLRDDSRTASINLINVVLVLITSGSPVGAAEQQYEPAALHSITSSAATRSVSGTVRSSALAALRLMTSRYIVGC